MKSGHVFWVGLLAFTAMFGCRAILGIDDEGETPVLSDASAASDTLAPSDAFDAPIAPGPDCPSDVPKLFALDCFTRELTLGFGAADRGGTWTAENGSDNYSVGNGVGRMQLMPGADRLKAMLPVSSQDTEVRVAFSVNQPLPPSATLWILGRDVENQSYRLAFLLRGGTARTRLIRRDASGNYFELADSAPGANYEQPISVGTFIAVRLQVYGVNPTQIRAKIYTAASGEPADWQHVSSDSTPALQYPGAIGLSAGLDKASLEQVSIQFDNLGAGPP